MRVFISLFISASLLIPVIVSAGEIHTAAANGNLKAVKTLLSDNPEILNARDENENLPLHLAVSNGHYKLVKYFLARGVDIESGDREHTSPLMLAALNGQEKIVKLLLSKGADVLKQDDNGMSALQWASYRGNTEIVKLLLDKGADVKAKKPNGSASLHGAAYSGHSETVELLIKRGAEIDAKNEAGYTPFLSACAAGQVEAAQILLNNGANLNEKLNNGWSAMHIAAESGNGQLVDLLMQRGMDVNAKTEQGFTPLRAAVYSRSAEVVEKLIALGAAVDGPDGEGESPLIVAARFRAPEIVDVLLRNGADVDRQGEEGNTALHFAATMGQLEITKSLLAHQANVNVKGGFYGRTPLHIASIKGCGEIADELVKGGASLNVKDKVERTPLYYACKYGNRKVAKTLKSKGGEAEDSEMNFGRSAYLDIPLELGEAALWYLGHCGWGIKTQNNFLIFDYWLFGACADEPCLVNGHIFPKELHDQNVTVFVTHEHRDHFDTTIFAWADKLPDIQYVYGFKAEQLPHYRESGYNGPEYKYAAPRTSFDLEGMSIRTIKSNDAGVGYLVKVDGLEIYHAGDHAGWSDQATSEEFKAEIDYLSQFTSQLDFAFLNVTGCRYSRYPEELRQSNYYTLNKLNTSVMIPTHAINWEVKYQEFADEAKKKGIKTEFFCAQNKGDHFFYKKGEPINFSLEKYETPLE